MLPSQVLQIHRAEVLEVMSRYPMFANLCVFASVAASAWACSGKR